MFKFLIKIIGICAWFLSVSQNPPTNLLFNGGFEQNFQGWNPSAILDNQIKFAGNYSARFQNSTGLISQNVQVETNKYYKVVFWVFLRNDFSGTDWGGVLCEVRTTGWQQLGSSIFINPENRQRNIWHQFAFEFYSGNNNSVVLSIGFFGGNGWNASFNVDEIQLFEKNSQNLLPIISHFSVNPVSGQTPLTTTIILKGFDIDGAIEGKYIHINDGSFYEGDSIQHTFYNGNTYTVTGYLRDDDGGIITINQIIHVDGTAAPTITITSPFQSDTILTDSNKITIHGTISSVPSEMLWFNEKNLQSGIISFSGNIFHTVIPLSYGTNEITIQARFSEFTFVQKKLTIIKRPMQYNGPELVQYSFSANQVKTFEKFEITFDLNTIADNYWFPYEQTLPANLHSGSGITVDCFFVKGNKILKFPAFYDMPYQRFDDYLLPTGKFVWKVRASFDEPGTYAIILRAQDSAGIKEYQLGTINVLPSDNKGFIRVSSINNKYFEYSTGESFFGFGFNDGVESPIQIDQKLTLYEENGINLLRVWLSSISQFSDPWCSWATHHQMQNNGYMNPPLYRFNKRYKNGDFSIRIAAPAIPNVNTPAIFRGFYDGGNNIKPNTRYRITIRFKLENVVGSGGFSLKFSDWAGESITQTNVGQRIYGPVKGSSDWIIGMAEFVSSPNQMELPLLYAVLEGDVSGEVYIDMVLLQEVFPDNSLSDNILSKWSTNPHYYFDPIKCRYFDYMIDKATNKTVHFKVVILEKDDYILNHIDPMGFTSSFYGSFDAPPGSKLRKLYEYYWRNIIARWGYSNAIHSFELVNEGAPGSYLSLLNDFSSFVDSLAAHNINTTTSFWSSWVPEFWLQSTCDYADVHAYAMTTGFIDQGYFLGELYDRERMKYDPAALAYIYSMTIGNDPLRNKPVIIGETDFDRPGDQAPDPQLAYDFQGIWLRGFLWGHLNAGGVSALFWDPSNLRNNNLFHIYKFPSAFFSQIPFHKTNFIEAHLTLDHPQARGWGIVDANGKRAYLYVSHRNFFWRYVLLNGLPSSIHTNLQLYTISPGLYQITIFNPLTGNILQQFQVTVGSDSILNLQNLFLNPDLTISAINTNLLSDNYQYFTNKILFSHIYPNPTSDFVTLEIMVTEPCNVQTFVIDIYGQILKEEIISCKSAGVNFQKIDVTSLPSGLYFLKLVYNENNTFVKKFLVNR